ncbi:MAG: PAS domain S-box protein [Planctomycetes bacterium]|nr:PAS domain S-box protein [Planctomycetota bacterium]
MKRKILTPLFAAGTCAAALSVWANYRMFSLKLATQLEDRVHTLAGATTYVAASIQDIDEMKRFVMTLGSERDVARIIVFGGQPARVIASSRHDWNGELIADISEPSDTDHDLTTGNHTGSGSSDIDEFCRTLPLVTNRLTKLGADLSGASVAIHLDEGPLRKALAKDAIGMTGVLIVALAGLMALVYALLRVVVLEPVALIAESITRRGHGDVRAQASVFAADEIGSLATTLHQAFDSLAVSEDRFRNIVNTAQEGICLVDKESRITFVNRRMGEMLGCDAETMFGKALSDFIVEDSKGCPNLALNGTQAKQIIERDVRLKREDGRDLWAVIATNRVLNDRGDFIGALALVTDISGRKANELRIRKSHAETESLLSSLSAILIGLDQDDRITRWNAAAAAAFGRSSQDMVGCTLAECGLNLPLEVVAAAISRSRADGRLVELSDLPFTSSRGDQGIMSLRVSLSTLAGEGEEQRPGVVLLGMDITERRMIEAQQSQGQKMESVGQLAAGIAHEINTPIQFIGDNLRFLGDALRDLPVLQTACVQLRSACAAEALSPALAGATTGLAAAIKQIDLDYLIDEIPKAVGQSQEGIGRVAEIVRAMKDFAHPGNAEKKPADLNAILRTTLSVARNEYKYVAEVETDFAPALPPVPCIIGELNQVFLNLLVNAAHAIGETLKDRGRGTITVSTALDGEWAEVRVRDTGSGIPEHVRPRMFEPFFTTKGVGRGTGQGLFISRTIIVKKHGGEISFTSEPGKGTTFLVRLPLTAVDAVG